MVEHIHDREHHHDHPGHEHEAHEHHSHERLRDEHHEREHRAKDPNRDPLTGEPGSHPVGTGTGAAAGAAAGAAIGSLAGPAGTLVGGAIGAVAGGAGGHAVGEKVNPSTEEEYWRDQFSNRPYYRADQDFEAYRPAYRHGIDNWSRNQGRSFEEVESDLSRDWDTRRGDSPLEWHQARHAARDAWERLNARDRPNTRDR